MPPAIEREMRRRVAIEPVIGHIKNEHRMGRNFRLLLNWLRLLLRLLLAALFGSLSPLPA